ncbi:MAG: SMI1/KNR4 family protein, partial [Zoogloeaceae bacterium]|nr:SMI1/KNR4 family protein [Zoogloeaceae bacterium]
MQYISKLPPTSNEAIDSFEQDLGICLPNDYRDFLLAQNGGKPDACDFDVPGSRFPVAMINTFYGILDDKTGRAGNSLNVANQDLMYRLPKGFIAIGDN